MIGKYTDSLKLNTSKQTQIDEALNKLKEKNKIKECKKSSSLQHLYSLWSLTLDKEMCGEEFYIYVFYSPLKIISGLFNTA